MKTMYKKVSIAGAFTKNSGIVILDEPSPALDPITEYNMYKSMMRRFHQAAPYSLPHQLRIPSYP